MIGTDTHSCRILQVGETYRDLGEITENADMQPAECRNGEKTDGYHEILPRPSATGRLVRSNHCNLRPS